ncbi:hypothetical protein UO65_5022 [Actinokineospora spheciospongiae]|uniref:KTSC domain-containing protein n=1 Tax=Actinokineospora spheciospongiae TaxID=909613 RepID=W7ISM0_9PSEU|nr:KTSC domain-containing protein [Actinokineospora spheciospongiae]EWC59717.1 hypothetical protein UO65_5022 [Actinokineospora spheciospongiae]PWW65559.1 KTSC domain-containing protein [Actinokineospora spheciospongiae]
MHRTQPDSAVIASIAFDAMTDTLEVEFHTGRVHRYLDVPKHVYWRFASAADSGSFFDEEVKDRFEEQRVR